MLNNTAFKKHSGTKNLLVSYLDVGLYQRVEGGNWLFH